MADNEGKIRPLLAEYADRADMHGLGNIRRAKTLKGKVVWSLLLLGGIGKSN